VSTTIIRENQTICVEDLAVKNIMKNHCLAQAMSDVSLGTFYTMLEYKANWNERSFVKIDRFFPSSKTCSSCGWIKQDLTLDIREWACPICGEKHDRDFNASKNILKQGLKILSGSGAESDIKQKQVEALSLDESMIPETY
jgi:transposase